MDDITTIISNKNAKCHYRDIIYAQGDRRSDVGSYEHFYGNRRSKNYWARALHLIGTLLYFYWLWQSYHMLNTAIMLLRHYLKKSRQETWYFASAKPVPQQAKTQRYTMNERFYNFIFNISLMPHLHAQQPLVISKEMYIVKFCRDHLRIFVLYVASRKWWWILIYNYFDCYISAISIIEKG